MWQQYVQIVSEHPFVTAFIQFLVLGTIGEVVSGMIRDRSARYPFTIAKTVLKALGWGLFGIYVKVMFQTGVAGFEALVEHGYLPAFLVEGASMGARIGRAFAISTLVNLMLGPSLMILHRLTDNAIDRLLAGRAPGWSGLDRSLKTLVWMWIPLHTFTFTQATELRVGIAAVLSLLLGVVMGYFNRRPDAD